MSHLTRRNALSLMTAAGTAVLVSSQEKSHAEETPLKGNLKQSVCRWCYKGIELDDLAREAAAIGLKSVELLGPEEWPIVQKHGLICAMPNGPGGITKGWNRIEQHADLLERGEVRLQEIADAGLPNMIVFSGNREGQDDREGIKNCAIGLKQLMPQAEKLGITVCMELLNSKRDHKDYQCDHTAWGVELVKEVGSDRFKLLYDIYHMQIMEGDVIATIQENIDYIGHFHTGGVPGRAEIDDTQELNYRRICEAIVETGYEGYLAQEFVPKRDPIESLKQAAHICDV
ncbi:MAG: TIM barrel protein [Candidatus Omnitrophica bacterium]|nr:TIM barrel protein [Candidatus Omnitrophota bacterium]MCB9784904.1 TIM barrel protein [Candidatus Omnitrophota bacterium]